MPESGLPSALGRAIGRGVWVVLRFGSALIRAARGVFIVCAALGASIGACEAAMEAGAAAAAAGMTGEIRGSVVDQTAPAHPVAGQQVRLDIVEPASNSTRVTTTDPQGHFAFPGLPLGGSRVFLVQVEYGGVPYTVRAVLTPTAPVRDVPLSVFVATSDRTAVRGTVAFAVFEPVHGALRVSVIQRLSNATDQAVAVTDKDPLVFPLPLVSPVPRAAEAVELVGGWRDPRVTDKAITDAIPVLPGVTEVAYAFGVAPRTRTATLRWEFPYGATDVELLADPSIGVSGADLHADGIVTERGRRYARWSGGPVRPKEAVFVRLDGLPLSADRWPEIAAGVLALALASGLAAALRRRPAMT
jgi:hypothetical protein